MVLVVELNCMCDKTMKQTPLQVCTVLHV